MSWRRFVRRAKWDRERVEEIESYLQIETDENIARGMPDSDARAAACRKLGNRTLIREEIYDMNTVVFLDALVRDIRHGLRSLRHSPGFTVVALLTLAIGIGANTAVFSVLNSVLLNPLAYPKPDELVAVSHGAPGAEGLRDGELRLSASMYFTYAEQNRTLQALGVWITGNASVTGLGEPEQLRTVAVSDGALQAFGVRPVLGRWFSQADQKPGGPGSVILSYGYWQRRFGGDRSVMGRNITVDSQPREIIGIMPKTFRFVDADFDLILPFAFDRSRLTLPGFGFRGVARLKPEVSIAAAEADIARLLPVWMSSWPAGAPGVNPRIYESWRIAPALRPLKQEVVGDVGDFLWILMGTVGVVLLIASANVANLLLVRAEARQQELAVRAALGAGWGRIVRALLVESVLLALVGGTLGVGLAYAGVRFLLAIGPASLPRLNEISIDPRALGFAAGISLLAGILVGLAPALKHAGSRISFALRAGGRTVSQSRERLRARNILVVGQIALSLVLLVSSGLMIRTFQALRGVQPGFVNAEQIQTIRISIPASLAPDPERVVRMQNEIADKLAAIPGVSSAAFTSAMPLEGTPQRWDAICIEDRPRAGSEIPPMRVYKFISPGLFQTIGARLITGRDYTWTDIHGRRPVIIISENLARELWGTPSGALGKRIGSCLPGCLMREVIGVVQDVHDDGVDQASPAIVYWPSFGESTYAPGQMDVARTVTFTVRTGRAGGQGFLTELSEAVWSVNRSLALTSVRTMQEVYDKSLARASFALFMLGIAAAAALTLGTIGIYGVISYAVSQRRREIGIRLALGAEQRALRRMFVRSGLALAAIGAGLGLGAAVGLTRLMKALLFGISPLDPATYSAAAVVLVIAAVVASYLPARRIAAVDPVEALKAE